jgi:hypothetical protein
MMSMTVTEVSRSTVSAAHVAALLCALCNGLRLRPNHGQFEPFRARGLLWGELGVPVRTCDSRRMSDINSK